MYLFLLLKVCKVKGFTGTQGVLIPKLNQADLMLRKDVVEAICQQRFHVYAIENVDQGIELLTGMCGSATSSQFPTQRTINTIDILSITW